MADATPSTPIVETLIDIDVDEIKIRPRAKIIFYRLVRTYSSGREEYVERSIGELQFADARQSFMQAAPLKKFLQWLVTNNYESNLTIN
jgi:hypothetical protein